VVVQDVSEIIAGKHVLVAAVVVDVNKYVILY
jgi:hypothetical protein